MRFFLSYGKLRIEVKAEKIQNFFQEIKVQKYVENEEIFH